MAEAIEDILKALDAMVGQLEGLLDCVDEPAQNDLAR